MSLANLMQEAEKCWEEFTQPRRIRILLGDGTCGKAAGSSDLEACIRKFLKKNKLQADIYSVGCLGLCYAEPLVEITLPDAASILYQKVTPEIIDKILEQHLKEGKLATEHALAVMSDNKIKGIPQFFDLPMLQGQKRLVTGNCGHIDPGSILHYTATGGFCGLEKALRLDPLQIISEIENSGLRGRGGAGFPTGRKWKFCHAVKATDKYMVCNADEGDPGAFMDRSLLEGDPYRVLEGLAIAARAIGANSAYIYCRAEYPLAIARLQHAILQMKKYNLLGENILKSEFNLEIALKEGAGAFVCGEETALMASIEGERGMPRSRPPFPAEKGLFAKPTNINNVETLGSVPVIISQGAKVFRAYGTKDSPGTKVFSLAGKVIRTGLIEVPMGIKIRDIIFKIGGGILNQKKLKAVQTGGPSGGCLPKSCLDLEVDYKNLTAAGSIMGSGGMIVIDEETCIPDLAKYFLGFTQKESCGKCTPCRLGTWQMLNILKDICAGKAKSEDLDTLENLAESIAAAALCGLGQTAPNPVKSTLRYFRKEYEEHVKKSRCPAGICKALMRLCINVKKCIGCTACARVCPVEAITGKPKKIHKIDQEKCIRCGKCKTVCRFDAVENL